MTEETRTARRTARRAPEVRCRAGGPAAPSRPVRRVPGLRVEVARVRGDAAVVTVEGEIDLHTADGLRAALVELHAAGFRRLVADFSAVPFCDATGLGALVAARNHLAARGGEIEIAGVRPAQLRLLRITGLHRLFPLHADAMTALASGDASAPSR